ncbi:unnamed protein product [Allacma fusca]|uniref:Uncharacterized protein n=1 Tax=Allacma fusca TaxID=39272 RepID=A0A8J2LS74_9HEXA|nr:unnamed protein product [Allacma fusca]
MFYLVGSMTYIPNNDQFPYVTPGSIVPTRFKHCREKWEPSIKMEKVHYEPCRMATDPMPTLGQTVWYDGEQNGAWFNYQIDFPICGFFLLPKTYLEFRMFFRTQNPDDCSWFENNTSGVSKELQTAMQKRIKFSSLIFGAADPEPPKDHPEVLCSNAIESGKPEWIESYDIHNYNVRLPSNNSWCTRASLEKDCFVGRCTKRLNNCNSYGWEWGRKTDKEASRKAANVSSRGEVIGYDNLTCYISDTVHVHSPCDWLRNGTDPDPYAKYPPYNPDTTRGGLCVGCLEAKNITEIYGIPCNSNIGRIIWGFRVTHGIFMALSTMFLVPWGTLFSRYYKETFMEKRYANVHVWHGMHIVLSLTGFGGICGGMAAGVLARYFLGFSTYMYVGRIHVAAGWLSTFFFLIVTATSCIRKFPLRVRVITIFLHFLIGTLTRFLWAVALLTSFYIPGSPSALNNIQRDGFTLEYFMIFVIFWLITDIVVHVLLRVFLSMADKKLTVPRNYAVVVPIPVIRPYAEKDTEGTGRRKIVLLVYAVISLLCALGLAVAMCWLDHWDSWKCNFGPMTETHNPGGKLGNMTDVWYDDLPKEPKY